MSASRLALVLVCALLAGGAAAAVPESASSALTISARDDGPGRNAQEDDAEALRIRREEAYRNTRRMRQLPPEVVAALVRGTVEFDDLSFNDDDTVVNDDAVRALKAAAAPPAARLRIRRFVSEPWASHCCSSSAAFCSSARPPARKPVVDRVFGPHASSETADRGTTGDPGHGSGSQPP